MQSFLPHRAHAEEWRRRYPFQSHYLPCRGFRYHFLDEGRGDPVVMIHGNPTWSFYFRSLVQALAPGYRVLVPDHLGCGLSDKPGEAAYDFRLSSRIADLEHFLAFQQLQRPITLVLHDWGGMIGMAYAVRHPERIGRIILMNTAAFHLPPGKRLPFRLRLIRNLKALATPSVLGGNLFAAAALRMASHRGLAPDVREGLTAPYDCWQHRLATLKFVQDIPLNPEDPSYPIVSHVACNLHTLTHLPMLICWGIHDFVFDADMLAEWRRRFPKAEIRTFAGAGHYVLEDEPEQVQFYVNRFLKRHPLVRTSTGCIPQGNS